MNHSKLTRVIVNGIPLSRYIDSCDISLTCDTTETTVFESPAKEYMPGLQDTTVSAAGFYDGAAGEVDNLLEETLGSGSDLWTWFPGGDAFGLAGRGMVAERSSYNVSSTVDGGSRITIAGQGSGQSHRITSLHPRGARTTTGVGSILDNGAESSGGAVGYLQAMSVTGSVSIKIEHSTNGTVWTDLLSFGAVTERGSTRVAVSGTVNRYVRAAWTLDGGEVIDMQVAFKQL